MLSVLRMAVLGIGCSALLACAASRPRSLADLGAADELGPASIWQTYVPSDDALEEFSQARRLSGLGLTGDAVARVRSLLERHPEFLEAHRLLQDLLLNSTSDWWLRSTYGTLVEEEPQRADAWYLQARISPDWTKQAQLFEEALERDPQHAYSWVGRAIAAKRNQDIEAAVKAARQASHFAPRLALPYLFLGHLAAARGETPLAVRFYGEARERDPEDTRPLLGLARMHLRSGRSAMASRAAFEALRLAPARAGVALFAADVLDEVGVPDHLRAALQSLDDVADQVGKGGVLQAVRGRLLVALGRPSDAEQAFATAVKSGFNRSELAVLERRAAIRAGHIVAAVHRSIERLPVDAFAPDNLLRIRWERLRSAAEHVDSANGTTQLELAKALSSVGWLDEARLVFAAAAAAAPQDAEVRRCAAREMAFHRFLSDLRALGRRLSDARRRRASGPGLDEVLQQMRASSIRRLGLDVTEGVVVRSYPLLGAFAISVASGGAFEREFGDRGLYLLLGERSGAPVELVIGRMVVLRSDAQARVLDTDLTFDECWIESAGLPAGLSGLRPGLAGLTLDRFVLIQLDAVRRRPAWIDGTLPSAARPAQTSEELRALDTPSRVAARIEWDLAADGLLETGMLDAVRRHELVHVYDARRLLPLHLHPFSALGFALQTGLSGRDGERLLEARAAALSIADCQEPRAALAALLAFLPARDGGSAHPSAYIDVIEHVLDILEEAPADFPSLEPGFNLVQQLDRLSDEEVRAVGVRLRSRF